MPRIAGDDPGYTFRMMRVGPGGSLTATPHGFSLDSVTTIIGDVIPKPFAAGTWHGFRQALEGLEKHGLPTQRRPSAEDLEAWLKSKEWDPNKRLDFSRDRGYIAHDVLELLVEGSEEIALGACYVEESLFGTKYGHGVYGWWLKQTAEFRKRVRSEVPVWSLRHRYAGTADLILPGRELLDLKTHKPAAGFTKPGQGGAYLGDLVQLRAYRMAWVEMGNAPTPDQRIVLARPNGTYLEDNREVTEEVWLQCLEMYRLLKSTGV